MKTKIFGETIGVALDLLVQSLGGDAVNRSEVAIEDDALAAQNEDRAADVLDRRKTRAAG